MLTLPETTPLPSFPTDEGGGGGTTVQITLTMRNRIPTLLAALCLALSLAAQTADDANPLESVYNQLRRQQGTTADSVRYTGDDFAKSGGFAWQRGTGSGWTVGCRLTLYDTPPAQVRKVRTAFEALVAKQFVNLNDPDRAGTYMENSRTAYLYQYHPADKTLYFLRATTSGEISIPHTWTTTDYLDARRHDPLSTFSDARLRQLGLARLWAEVKRNFVFMDRVRLDWDNLYLATLPLVEQAQTFGECTRLLQRMAARLADGHTYVYGDTPDLCTAPLTTRLVGDRVYVDQVESNRLAAQGVRRGMELLRIDGEPVIDYGRRAVSPYVSSSTPQWTAHETYEGHALLTAPTGDTLTLTLRDSDGELHIDYVAGSLKRNAATPRPTLEFRVLQGRIGYLRIRDFMSASFRQDFDRLYPDLLATQALIVDVRDNSGGNSGNADYVLRHLTADSIRTDSWSSPTYIPALASWGRKAPLYHSPSSLMPPIAGTTPYLRPVAVLVDRGTFSAAEDFCAVFRGMKRGPLVGTPTGGSTGNGVRVTLIPGHAYANICAKHDVAPDGTEFVGTGLHPTVEVRETYASLFRDKTDAALTEALRLLAADATPQPAPAKPR